MKKGGDGKWGDLFMNIAEILLNITRPINVLLCYNKSQFVYLQRLKIVRWGIFGRVIPHSTGRTYVLIKHHGVPEQSPWIFHKCTVLHWCRERHAINKHYSYILNQCFIVSLPFGRLCVRAPVAKTNIGTSICCIRTIKVKDKRLVGSKTRQCLRTERHVCLPADCCWHWASTL